MDRGDLEIEQTGGGGPDQHHLAGEVPAGTCRCRRSMAEMYLSRSGGAKCIQIRPLPSVGISIASTLTLRTPLASVLIRMALDPVVTRSISRDKEGTIDAVGDRNDRNAADNAIPLGNDRENAMSIRRSVENGQVPQQVWKVDEERARIGSESGDPDWMGGCAIGAAPETR